MQGLVNRYNYLFRSTKGLVLVAMALIALVTAFFGMISGPMAEFGIRDIWVRLTGMSLVPAEREGRIVMLYHTIAMAVVAIETYSITALIKLKDHQRTMINATITVGYIVAMKFGLLFAYFGHNWIFHRLFLFGQSPIFFAGVVLTVALNPWSQEHRISDPAHARRHRLERAAFFAHLRIALHTSALWARDHYFGAVYRHATPLTLWRTFFNQDGFYRETPDRIVITLKPFSNAHVQQEAVAAGQRFNQQRITTHSGRLIEMRVADCI
jgi:hypothetical protein